MNRLKLDIQKFGGIYSVSASVISQDIQTNRSTIRITASSTTTYDTHNTTGDAYINGSYSGGASGNLSAKYIMLDYDSTASVSWDIVVQHRSDGTCGQINISCYHYITDNTNGWSSTSVTPSTIPRYATSVQSLKSKTETSITMNWSSDSTCDYVWYSTNNGSNWTAIGSVNASSGSYTISGLSVNTTYNIKTRVRRKDSQLTTDSSNLQVKTYNWPNCTSAPNFTIGNSVTLQFDNPLNRTFAIRMWSHTSQGFVTDSININGTSYTFTPNANTLYASIPNAKSSVYNIDCTYNTNKLTKVGGSYSVNETTSKPTFNDFTYEDINATTTTLTGNNQYVVQGYSNIQATISTSNKATAQNSASMVRYTLVIGNASNSVNYSSDASVNVTINNAPSNIINLYAEDSRGLTTLVSKTATLKAYTTIQKNEINVERANNVGTGVTLTYNGTLWGESFGSVTNTAKSARYRFKKTNEDWPQTWNGTTTITPTTSGSNYSFTGGIAGDLGNTGFSAEYSFNIEVEVFDELSSTTFSFTLGTGIPHIAIDDGGVAIKQPYNTTTGGALQVNGNIYSKGTGTNIFTENTTSGGECFVRTKTTAKTADFGVGGSGRRGLYDRTLTKWTLSNDDNKVYLGMDTEVDGDLKATTVNSKLETINGRITNANITHAYENDKAHLQLLIASGSMTSNKPSADGFIVHCSWDNSGQYVGQLYLPNTNGNIPMQFRGCNNGTWGSWEDVHRAKVLYTNASGTNGTVQLSETASNFQYIEIFFAKQDKYAYNSVKVYTGINMNVVSLLTGYRSQGIHQIQYPSVKINGTSITKNDTGGCNLPGTVFTGNEIYIYRVVGYR